MQTNTKLSEDRTRLGSNLEEKVEQFAHFAENDGVRRETANNFLQNHVTYDNEQYLDLGDIGVKDEDLRNVEVSDFVEEKDIDELADLDPSDATDWSEFQRRREELSQQTVNPDFDVLNYENLREAGVEGNIVSHERNPQIPVGRGDQAPKADFQRLVWEAAENAAIEMLEDEVEGMPDSQHVVETKEQTVLAGEENPPNAKHLGIIHQYLIEEGEPEHYPLGERPDNSTTVSEVDTDRAWAALFGNKAYGIEDGDEIPEKAVDLHEDIGSRLDLKTAGDFNDVPMFELLLKAEVPPRFVHAPLGEGTVGEQKQSEQDLEGTYTTELMFSPEQSREEGTLVYSAMYDGEIVTRTVDEIIDGDGHTTAAQNYDIALPLYSLGDRLWFNNPVRGAEKYQGALSIEDAVGETTDGEYDSHPFIDMGFPAVDLETGQPVNEELAEAMEETPHGDAFGPLNTDMLEGETADWEDDDILYHRNAALMAMAVEPEFAEYFREELVPKAYEEVGVEAGEPADLEMDEFLTKAYELGAEALAEGTYKTEQTEVGIARHD